MLASCHPGILSLSHPAKTVDRLLITIIMMTEMMRTGEFCTSHSL